MKKVHITTIVLVVLVLLATGCSKSPTRLFTAPLCDCNCQVEESNCHPWEICDSSAACITAGAKRDKCIPANKRIDENEY